MKRSALALVVCAALVPAAAAPAALNAYRTGITLPQAVKLGDGSVLPAGKYEVQIDYRGFGNAAELHFFQGGVLKGKAPAEARGFPSQAPTGGSAAGSGEKWAPAGDAAIPKVDGTDKSAEVGRFKGGATSGDPHEFSWGAHGFAPGKTGKVTPAAQSLKLSFDSSNSAAGIIAVLPVAAKGK